MKYGYPRSLALAALVWFGCVHAGSAWAQTPSRRLPPTADFQRTAPTQKRVLVIGIDGCRPNALWLATTPNLDRLKAAGAFTDDARAVLPTSSGPNWASLLTGVEPAKHGVHDNTFVGANFATFPHFFVRLKEKRPSTFAASFTQWDRIATDIVAGADLSLGGLTDEEVALQAASLLNTGQPQVVFLHLNDVDAAGHAFGFNASVPEYLAAVEATDTRVGIVINALNQRTSVGMNRYEDWLVVVTTDHGGLDFDHGGSSLPEQRTWLTLSGPSIQEGLLITNPVDIVDISATVLDHLGIALDPTWGLDGGSLLPLVRL